jgi:hypothetical protein
VRCGVRARQGGAKTLEKLFCREQSQKHDQPQFAPCFLVRPISMTIDDLTFHVFKWLNTVVYLVGLGIAILAFLRCRKQGYLLVALFFALVLFSWHVWPSISHAIYVHRTPLETQQKINDDYEQAVNQVYAKEGPRIATLRANIQIAPIILVVGLWLLARREPEYHRPDQSRGRVKTVLGKLGND